MKDQREHDQFQEWWRQQPQHKDREAMKLAWKAWKASKRNTVSNLAEDKRQIALDTFD